MACGPLWRCGCCGRGTCCPGPASSLVPTTEPISGDVLTAAGTAVSGGLPAVGSPAGAAAAETAARTGQSLGHIAAVVWLVGMAAMALYLAGSYVRLRVRLRTAVRLEDGVWESEQAPSPFVLGFIRPRIYLPFGLDRGSRDYVLAHERTHIRHRDHWVKPLAFLLLAVYWFNPCCGRRISCCAGIWNTPVTRRCCGTWRSRTSGRIPRRF